MPIVTTSIRELDGDQADRYVGEGACYVDLRPIDEYLDVHIPGSISLQYEFGPGMPGRARDCIPLEVPLIATGIDAPKMPEVAAALRGKGFTVLGCVPDGVTSWGQRNGAPASTALITAATPPEGTLLSVGDPGSVLPDQAMLLPLERLWHEIERIPGGRVVVASGRGVRAAMAVGMLERSGRNDVVLWRYTRK